MLQNGPQLFLLASLPPSFHLRDLEEIGRQSDLVTINTRKFKDLDLIEAVVDGITCTISQLTPHEIQREFIENPVENIFCGRPAGTSAGIGISLGNNLTYGKHLGTVNCALLRLAVIAGKFVDAQSVLWRPASVHTSFSSFSDLVAQHANGGPFPSLAQIAILDNGDGVLVTRGLDYFSSQEIELQTPPDDPPDEALGRLVRLIQKAATGNGNSSNMDAQNVPEESVSFTS